MRQRASPSRKEYWSAPTNGSPDRIGGRPVCVDVRVRDLEGVDLVSRTNSSGPVVVEIGPQLPALRLIAEPSADTVRVACRQFVEDRVP